MSLNVLIVEDESGLRRVLAEAISMEGHSVTDAATVNEATEKLNSQAFDLVLTDMNLPDRNGLDFIPVVKNKYPDCIVLVMTGYGTMDNAIKAMKLGAADFISKPIQLKDLLSLIRVAAEKSGDKTTTSAAGADRNSPIIAKSKSMLNLLEQLETIAPYKLSVLITGETGTGKELFARELHNASVRVGKPFVALNCAAIPDQLLESELFGHVKGSFTGAHTDRKGRFEQADGGTLFLDEIGDMDLALQAKLLRVLQESEFERVGSGKVIKVDVRIVAATSSNIEQKIADGTFRPDLYHRLNVVHLSLPPLRQRPDDILPIANALLERFCKASGLPNKRIGDDVRHTLISYSFPGNVRQLQNIVERAAVFSGAADQIHMEHLPEEVRNQQNMFQITSATDAVPRAIPDEGIDFANVVSQVERDLLLQTLEKTGGNKMQAAKLLNMKRTTLVEKIKRLQIDDDDDAADETQFSKVG